MELVEVLNGVDATLGNGTALPFSSMVADARSLMEWCVANRQNALEWALTHDAAMDESNFTASPLRMARLKTLTSLAKDFGLKTGVDVPIGAPRARERALRSYFDAREWVPITCMRQNRQPSFERALEARRVRPTSLGTLKTRST